MLKRKGWNGWVIRLLLLAASVMLLLTMQTWFSSLGEWLVIKPNEYRVDAIVVLSGGGPKRLTHGIDLYKRGLAPQLWYTGNAPAEGMTTFTDAQLARKFAIEQGVPEQAISLLSTTSTWEDGREIAAKVSREHVHSVLLVTDWYHSRRALCVARHQLTGTGASLYYSPSTDPTYGPDGWWYSEEEFLAVNNELIKSALYRLKYDLTPWRCDQLAYSATGAASGRALTGTPLSGQWGVLGILGCALSYAGVACMRRWAGWRQVMDVPNERSSHTTPTPKGGGLPIVVLTLGGLIAWVAYSTGALGTSLLVYVACGALIAGVSWIDDLRSLPNRVRFGVHSLCALLTIWTFGSWSTLDIPMIGQVNLGLAGLIITFLWVVGLTNAYNFMDGIDGLAGSQAVIAGFGWMLLGLLSGQTMLGALGLLIAAASLGFLIHNWPPARIFMGDVGSAFLGFSLAVLGVAASQADPRLPFAGILLIWPFLFDAGFTFLRRLVRRENVFVAHRTHLYQRLVIVGYEHRTVTLLYCGLALVGAGLSLFWYLALPAADIAVATLLPLLCGALWLFVVRQERRGTPLAPLRQGRAVLSTANQSSDDPYGQ